MIIKLFIFRFFLSQQMFLNENKSDSHNLKLDLKIKESQSVLIKICDCCFLLILDLIESVIKAAINQNSSQF